ncbi:hypothetical protein [[Clostridium] scindens]|uniref:hypothetical protein n=1 Tax=Clostridium scindens (strain JCM 10418 / VPI 12708) TaxID=29347 RepID=UPI003AB8D33F
MYNMQLNTGYAGKPHVTAENCADLNRGLLGSDSYVLPVGTQFEVELVTNNLLKIKDGCGCMQGRQVSIAKGQIDEITIENGTQGEKRIDLVVIRYSKNPDTGIETAIPFLIKGIPSEMNPVRPLHLDGDIRGGDLTVDWPLYELYLDGISVTNVKPLFDVLMSVDSLNRKLPELVVASSSTISYTPDRDCKVLVTYEVCGWGFGGTTWQIEITGSASSGDSPIRADMKRGVFDGTDGIYKDVSTSAYFIGLRAGVTYTFNRVSYAGSGGKEANPFMKLLAV